jgi:hypothetical protein
VLADEPVDVVGSSSVSTPSFLIPSVVPDLFGIDDEAEQTAQQVALRSDAVPVSVWEDFHDWIDAT